MRNHWWRHHTMSSRSWKCKKRRPPNTGVVYIIDNHAGLKSKVLRNDCCLQRLLIIFSRGTNSLYLCSHVEYSYLKKQSQVRNAPAQSQIDRFLSENRDQSQKCVFLRKSLTEILCNNWYTQIEFALVTSSFTTRTATFIKAASSALRGLCIHIGEQLHRRSDIFGALATTSLLLSDCIPEFNGPILWSNGKLWCVEYETRSKKKWFD